MSAITTPPLTGIAGPTRDYPADFGLFSVVEDAGELDQHWVNGIQWEHASAGAVSGISDTCADEPTLGFVNLVNRHTDAAVRPFTLFGSHTCSTLGATEQSVEAIAIENLLRHEQEGVEEAISTETLGLVPRLVGDGTATFNSVQYAAATDLTSATATSIGNGLGLLSNYAASVFGLAGCVLHVPRIASAQFASYGVVTRVDNHIETITGEKVAFGGGYANTAPDGTPAGTDEVWVYITPPVLMKKSEVDARTFSSVDHRQNNFNSESARTFAIGWDNLPIAAALITLP